MSKMFLVIVTAAAISSSGTFALGADPNPAPDVRDRAERALKEGADKIMRALELMMRAVPQYEIIIRRRNPDPPGRSPRRHDRTDETAT
jgi:hypothetical protein